MADKCSPHGWTLDTLEKFLSTKVDALDRLLTARMDGAERSVSTAMSAAAKAIEKSDEATEKRLDAMNEFRAALNDQTKLSLPRIEYTNSHNSLVDKLNESAGRLNERIGAVGDRVTALESGGRGKSQGFGTAGAIVLAVFAGIGTAAGVGALVVEIMRH